MEYWILVGRLLAETNHHSRGSFEYLQPAFVSILHGHIYAKSTWGKSRKPQWKFLPTPLSPDLTSHFQFHANFISYHGKRFLISFEAATAPATDNFTKSPTFGKYTQQVAGIYNSDFVRLVFFCTQV